MKLTWQSIGKKMDTQIDHTYMGIETCIKNDQKESRRVPGSRAAMRLTKKMELVNKYRMIICISRNRVNQSCVANKSTNQSINYEIKYVGLPPKPNSFL